MSEPPTLPENTAPKRNRAAPIEFWRIAERFLGVLCSLFGEPQDIAMSDTITRKAHALMIAWLAAGEALLRRLLLLEAKLLHLDPVKPKPRHQRRPRVRKPFAFYPDAPQDWRVSFAVCPAAKKRTTPDASRCNGARPSHRPGRWRCGWKR